MRVDLKKDSINCLESSEKGGLYNEVVQNY